jgi:hypothetical protein
VRFAFSRVDALPRLSWCARLAAGSDVVEVRHGPWVETRGDFFVEGAWEGDFGAGELDRSVALVGTGGRAGADGVRFSASAGRRDRLYLARGERELWISNSPVFALVASGDELDLACRRYLWHFVAQVRLGVRRERRTLPTRRGALWLFEAGNLEVGADLSFVRLDPPAPPAPRDFTGYLAQLEAALAGVLANAGDARRAQRHRPLVALSRGYDSPAVAVLAARLGCHEALTFAEHAPGEPAPEDDGSEIGARLGLATRRLARTAFATRPGLPEAEFCVLPPGHDVVWAGNEEPLVGSLVLNGFGADGLWSLDASDAAPDLARPSVGGLAGTTLAEFRLRVGFQALPLPTIGWQNAEALLAISRSEEMRPWSVGGRHDRPIPRRIVEQAGVPRGSFADAKRASALYMLSEAADLSPASRRDYESFLRERFGAAGAARLHALDALHRAAARGAEALRAATGVRVRAPLRAHRLGRAALLPHWGFERIRARYESAR